MYNTQLDRYSGYYEVVNLCSNGIVIDINYRNTEDIDLTTQLDVFDEEFSVDQVCYMGKFHPDSCPLLSIVIRG